MVASAWLSRQPLRCTLAFPHLPGTESSTTTFENERELPKMANQGYDVVVDVDAEVRPRQQSASVTIVY